MAEGLSNSGKPKAVYFNSLNFSPSNLSFAAEFLDLVQFDSVSTWQPALSSKSQVLFAPLDLQVDYDLIQELPYVRLIITNTTSTPQIDLATIAERGIAVASLAGDRPFLERITPVAELTVGFLVACSRQIYSAHSDVMRGNWNRFDWGSPRMLSRMSIGLVGFGRLGSMVGRYCAAMGMIVRYFDPYVPGGESDIFELARKSDFLSVHASLTDETRGLISSDVIASMPTGSSLINTARGEIVDEEALLNALRSGHLRSAALDVLNREPMPGCELSESPLLEFARETERLLITPHIGGSTTDAWLETQRRVLEIAHEEIASW